MAQLKNTMLLVMDNSMADVNPCTDIIIHIGAGQCSELEAYLATQAQRIILVEPNPVLAARLRGNTQQYPHVDVLELAITDNPEHNTLYEYNLPEASGLYLADGLKALFPGLRQVTQYAVATQTPQGLIHNCQIQGENNTLIVQASGAERAIVNALIESEQLSHFNQLKITCSEHPVFNRDGDAEHLSQTLQNEGFELKAKDSHNPDWPVWTYVSSPLARKLKSVTQKNQEMTNALAQTKQELDHSSASLTQTRSELEQARAKHKDDLATWESAKSELAAQLKKVQQEQAENAKQAQAEREHIEAELKAAREAAEQLELEKTKLDKKNAEQSKTLEEAKTRYANDLQLWEQKTQDLNEQLEKAKKQRKERDEENLKLQNDLKSATESARESAEKVAQNTEKAKHNAEQLKKEHAKQINALQEQLAVERAGKEQFNELKKKMDYLFGQQTLQLEQAANALGRHVTTTVTNTAKDLEAGIALQQQYGQDLPNLEDQSGRLPASVALQLSRQLKTQPYDVIIELGSGVTTTFMAHTLKNTPRNEESSEGTELARYVDPSEDDLPKRIVCFEHNRAKYNELSSGLKKSGLAPVIGLEFSPLVPYNYQGQEYLFYDCASRLQQIAKLLEGRQARIFVLVNRASGDSQPEPLVALPQLLQYLSAHILDVVVHAQGRSELSEQWYNLLEQRGLEHEKAAEFGSPNVKKITVNP